MMKRTLFQAFSSVPFRNRMLPAPAACCAGLLLAALLAALPAGAAPGDACEIETKFTRRQCDSEGLAGTPLVRGANCRVVRIDGFPREYIVYVPRNPSFDPDDAMPVVFMFHGSSGDATKFLKISGWREKAEEVGLLAVFPTGLEHKVLESGRCTTKWNDYSLPDEIDPDVKPRTRTATGAILDYPAGAPWPPDDVAFVQTMLDDVEAGAHVDRARVFATGFSNGANFTARVAVELADRFAAAAWVGGGLDGVHVPDVRRMPVAIVAGQCDDRLAERLALPLDKVACVGGLPNAGGLPLDPAEWPAIPGLASFVADHLASFGLEDEPDATHAEATFGQVTWRTPAAGNFDGNLLKLTVLGGTTHQYPRCNDDGCNNPNRWNAADRFWQLWSAYEPGVCGAP
jgi:poly(3-hydroxybutyrate) depolymerase